MTETRRRGDERLTAALRPLFADVGEYSRVLLPAHQLREYQLRPGRAIAESIAGRRGMQFAVVFSRQAGKDEMLAQLLAWLLTRYQVVGGSAVVAAPTITQAYVSRDRLLGRLRGSALTVGRVRSREGYIVGVGRAEARGQTASLLLAANEAQDVDPAIWDARFDPMAASTNATTEPGHVVRAEIGADSGSQLGKREARLGAAAHVLLAQPCQHLTPVVAV